MFVLFLPLFTSLLPPFFFDVDDLACCCTSLQQGAVLSNVLAEAGLAGFTRLRRSHLCRRGGLLTWADAETSDDPNNASDADVAHEGQVSL